MVFKCSHASSLVCSSIIKFTLDHTIFYLMKLAFSKILNISILGASKSWARVLLILVVCLLQIEKHTMRMAGARGSGILQKILIEIYFSFTFMHGKIACKIFIYRS